MRKSGAGGKKKHVFFFKQIHHLPSSVRFLFAILSIFPKEKTAVVGVMFAPRFSTPISGQAYIPPPSNGANQQTTRSKRQSSTKNSNFRETSAMELCFFFGRVQFSWKIPGNDGHVANITALKWQMWTISPSFCMPDLSRETAIVLYHSGTLFWLSLW